MNKSDQTTGDLNVVGQSVLRRDGLSHVTGKTQYVDDLQFPDMLHLKMVRSPLHHARIRGIDFSEAEKVPGFVRALTYKDVPKNIYTILCLIGVGPDEEPVLAENEVLFKGEQIAAIVAETEEAAIEAVARVRLDLEELPAVFDVEEALKPGAPILKPWGTNYFVYEGHHCRRIRFGDVEEGFAQADYIVEGVLRAQADRARAAGDDRLRGQAGGRRPHHRLHQHPGALLLDGQHRADPAGAVQQAALCRRHGGRRLRRQGRRHRRADRHAGGHARPGSRSSTCYTREEEFHVSSTRVRLAHLLQGRRDKDGHIVARQVTSYADSAPTTATRPTR